MRNNFLLKRKIIKPLGLQQQTGRSIGLMPIGTMKKSISKHLGRGTTPLLLSTDLGSANIRGEGFGVKTPNPQLIQKLGNLNIGEKPRKNVRLIL